jgi:hypothetical protein
LLSYPLLNVNCEKVVGATVRGILALGGCLEQLATLFQAKFHCGRLGKRKRGKDNAEALRARRYAEKSGKKKERWPS